VSLFRLVLGNLAHGGARSIAVAFGASLVAAFALLSSMVVAGAQQDLADGVRRLGADVVVYPWGTALEERRVGYLIPAGVAGSIPGTDIERIAEAPGVEAASPQFFLAALTNPPDASAVEAYVAAFDPATDFVLAPWIDPAVLHSLAPGQAIAGADILDPEKTGRIEVGGYSLRIAGQLAVTGTDMDHTVFVGFDTAREMASGGPSGDAALDFSPGGASAVLVRIKRGEDVREVAAQIMDRVPGTLALSSARMLQGQRTQIFGLLNTVSALATAIWVLSVVFIGLVFTMTVNARRRQIGVLRALGSSRLFVVRALVAEGALLGVAGGAAGVLLAAVLAFFLQKRQAVPGLSLVLPGLEQFLALAFAALLLSAASVALASLAPVLRISRAEPAQAMRE
jgi:putative ABC transport system permease protein